MRFQSRYKQRHQLTRMREQIDPLPAERKDMTVPEYIKAVEGRGSAGISGVIGEDRSDGGGADLHTVTDNAAAATALAASRPMRLQFDKPAMQAVRIRLRPPRFQPPNDRAIRIQLISFIRQLTA